MVLWWLHQCTRQCRFNKLVSGWAGGKILAFPHPTRPNNEITFSQKSFLNWRFVKRYSILVHGMAGSRPSGFSNISQMQRCKRYWRLLSSYYKAKSSFKILEIEGSLGCQNEHTSHASQETGLHIAVWNASLNGLTKFTSLPHHYSHDAILTARRHRNGANN